MLHIDSVMVQLSRSSKFTFMLTEVDLMSLLKEQTNKKLIKLTLNRPTAVLAAGAHTEKRFRFLLMLRCTSQQNVCPALACSHICVCVCVVVWLCIH